MSTGGNQAPAASAAGRRVNESPKSRFTRSWRVRMSRNGSHRVRVVAVMSSSSSQNLSHKGRRNDSCDPATVSRSIYRFSVSLSSYLHKFIDNYLNNCIHIIYTVEIIFVHVNTRAEITDRRSGYR